MPDRYFKSQRVRTRIHANPIRKEIERLLDYLFAQGYARDSVHAYVGASEHFGRWLGKLRKSKRRVDRSSVMQFLQDHLPRCGCSRPALRQATTARAGLMHLLRAIGEATTDVIPQHPNSQLVVQFLEYLKVTCGLAVKTRQMRETYVRQFLEWRFPNSTASVAELQSQDVVLFVSGYAAHHKCSTVAVAASSLRSFFRFLQVRGLCCNRLLLAVPTIRKSKRSSLPKIMGKQQLASFLQSFDRLTATGRRDYAMAISMTYLGLRVSEVCTIEISHVDWRNGIIGIFSSKGRRGRELPLMPELGQAIANYVKSGRPASKSGNLFLRHTVRAGTPVSRELVRSAMRRAYRRSGCAADWTGTHILRHTAATRLLQHGASIKEIADVLGHRSIDTSLVYTKLDLGTLSSVAMPWPEGEQQ